MAVFEAWFRPDNVERRREIPTATRRRGSSCASDVASVAASDVPVAYRLLSLRPAAAGCGMMYDAYQGMADAGDRVRLLAANAEAILKRLVVATRTRRPGGGWRPITSWSRSPASPTRGPIRASTASRSTGRRFPVEERAVMWTPFCQLLPFPQGGRRGRSQGSAGRADVGPFRHAAARHDPHASARPSGLRHRLDQPAQRQARGGRIRARGLHQPPDRFRALHRRGLPRRRRLPADGFGARGDRGHGARGRQRPAREPDADGRADRRARRADQGQRARAGEADRMVPRPT